MTPSGVTQMLERRASIAGLGRHTVGSHRPSALLESGWVRATAWGINRVAALDVGKHRDPGRRGRVG